MDDDYVADFLKIDWNIPPSTEQRQKFCKDFNEFEANSPIFQIIHDKLIEFPVYIQKDEEECTTQLQKNCPRVYCPGYDKNLRLPTSIFSEKEMRKLFTHALTVRKGQSVSLQQNLDEDLMNAVSEEQAKYLSVAQEMWTRFNYKRVFHVNNFVEMYMRELWLKKVEAVQQFYPKAYKQTGSLHFVCESVDMDNVVHLSEDVILKKQHSPRRIRIPKRWIYHSIPISYEDLTSIKDPLLCLAKEPVSADQVAWDLAKVYKPDVVLTGSALKALANNLPPHYMTEWSLIVTVKEIDVDGIKKKIVFIDKPLPPCTLTNTQHSQWHAKLASKMLVVDEKNVQLFNDASTQAVRSEETRKISAYDDDDWLKSDSDIESFGLCSNSQSVSSLKSEVNEDEPTHIKMDTEAGSSNCSQMDSSANLELSSQKNKKNPKPPDYSYRLWNLSSITTKLEENQKILRKGGVNTRPLSLIVRNKIDGIVNCSNQIVDGVVSSKVEYQEDLGAEIMTLTELVNEWLDLTFRPSSCLVRVRVNYKGEYIMTERKKLYALEAEALKLHQFILKSTLKTLQFLLCQLCNLSTGQYYVAHSPNYGAFAYLYTSVLPTTQNVFNLHEFCRKNWFKGIAKDQHALWKPLDMSIFTPMHFHLKRIPGTFKPVHKVLSTVTQRAKLKAFKIANINQKRVMRNKKRAAAKLKQKIKKAEENKAASKQK